MANAFTGTCGFGLNKPHILLVRSYVNLPCQSQQYAHTIRDHVTVEQNASFLIQQGNADRFGAIRALNKGAIQIKLGEIKNGCHLSIDVRRKTARKHKQLGSVGRGKACMNSR